jgi:AraC-like DNA-binding protein
MTQDALQYAEFPPPPALRRVVKCIWRLRGPAASASAPEPVIPDGCVEVVLNCGDPFRRYHERGSEVQPIRLLAGQLTRAVSIAPTGRVDLWGIRFHPWGAAPFLGVAGSDLCDRMLPLDAVSGVDPLRSWIFDGETDAARARLLGAALLDRLPRVRAVDAKVPALAALAAHDGVSTVKKLASISGLSVRRVQTLFAENVGISPKALMRLARFQRAIALARRSATMSLARVAAESGYFDHAHLVRDARDIAGMTPSALMPDMGAITRLFVATSAASAAA